MNNKVDETAGTKAAEEVNGGSEGQAGPGATEESVTPAQDPADNGETAAAPDVRERRPPARRWRLVLFLVALLAIAAGAAGYLYFDISEGRKADEAKLRSLAAGVDALQQSHASLAENTRLLDQRLTAIDERFTGMLRELNSLYRHRNSDIGWQLAEVKYLFLIASQRLALARDVATAQAILQSADARLVEIADPALIPVRERLIADINRLQAARSTDYAGLALMLADLSVRADELPLNLGGSADPAALTTDTEPLATDNRWQRLARDLWQELKSLVVISRTDNNTAALLAPQERYFLYRNLRLQLEMSRMALLIRDEDQYRISVAACTEWLNEYFDTGDARVRSALDLLENAGSIDFDESVPFIDATLDAFDEYLAGIGNTVTGGGLLQ